MRGRDSLTIRWKNGAALCLILTAGCKRPPVSMDDPSLTPFASMYSVDRGQYGFTPLPKTGRVFIEGESSKFGYDALLEFVGTPTPTRSIAFRWDGHAYQWLGEQEIFDGPRRWKPPKGRRDQEYVAITFYREELYGENQGLTIYYSGPDATLSVPPPGET